SVLDNPRALLAPRQPYRASVEHPYADSPTGPGLREIPIAVTPLSRLHVIGPSLILAPTWLRRRLVAASLNQPFFNLELHGIDLADPDTDGFPPALMSRQPD